MVVEEVSTETTYYEVGGERKKTVPFTIELREWLIIAHKIGLVFLDTLQDIRLLTVHQQGMVCGSFENLAIYQFSESNTDADDGESVIKPENSYETGRWLLRAKLDSGYNELVFKNLRTLFPSVGNPLYLYIARDTRYIYWWNPTTNTYHNAITNFATQSFFSENSGKLGGELPSHYYNLARLIDCMTAGQDIEIDTTTIAGKIIINYTGSSGLSFTDISAFFINGTNTTVEVDSVLQTIKINANGGTQIQSDWNQTNNTQVDYIKNKPTEFPPSAHAHSDTEVNLTETYTGNLAGATTQKDANDILNSLTVTPYSYSTKTLVATDWALNISTGLYEQDIILTDIVSTSYVEVIASTNRTYYNDYIDNQILITEITTDTLTFEAVVEPLSDIVIEIKYII